MLVPCEVASKSLVPAIRALVAEELTQVHGLKQVEVASLLGITQTAVSKYVKHVRGRLPRIWEAPEVRLEIDEIAALLACGKMSRYQLAKRFCILCQDVRRKGLLCELCKRYDASISVEQCDVCNSGNPEALY